MALKDSLTRLLPLMLAARELKRPGVPRGCSSSVCRPDRRLAVAGPMRACSNVSILTGRLGIALKCAELECFVKATSSLSPVFSFPSSFWTSSCCALHSYRNCSAELLIDLLV
jgi:hypothetical protein